MNEKEKQCDIEMYDDEANGARVKQIRVSLSETATQWGYIPVNQQARTMAYEALGLIQAQDKEIQALKAKLAANINMCICHNH
tara:strand:- start:4446 stop:4694 length:249 start_codon:yes stop_codon:yes gene_type:complete